MKVAFDWPRTLRETSLLEKPIVLRRSRFSDAQAWGEIRRRNSDWVQPWESSDPKNPSYRAGIKSYLAMMAAMRREALLAKGLPWMVCYGDQLVGQLAISDIVWG